MKVLSVYNGSGSRLNDHSQPGCDVHTSTRACQATLSTDSVEDINKEQKHEGNAPKMESSAFSGVSPNGSANNPMPDFDNTANAYAPMTTKELYRAIVTLQICQLQSLVNYSEFLLWLTRRALGNTVTDASLKATLFGHFCGGTDRENIQPRIRLLEQQGVGSILDYAAEDDGEENKYSLKRLFDYLKGAKSAPDELPVGNTASTEHKVRVYDYESEAKCNQHMESFSKCIVDAAALGKDGYAAVKVTALGPPALLEMMSTAIVEGRKLFAKFDTDGNGLITASEFEEQYNKYFHSDPQKMQELKDNLRCPDTGCFDYIAWSLSLSPRDLPRITSACREKGPLSMATPTEEELKLMDSMFHRAHTLAQTAAENGVRLLIDAEQVRFQPAIDNLVWELQTTYNSTENTDYPLIYGTYQCYLKDALDRLKEDVERSERYNFHFGAKLVRGAYMESERKFAKEEGFPSPIHDSLENTHASYNETVEFLLQHASLDNGKHTEVMLATHNRESIEKAIAAMDKYGISRSATTISFGQLYGMADNLSFNLGKHGYVLTA